MVLHQMARTINKYPQGYKNQESLNLYDIEGGGSVVGVGADCRVHPESRALSSDSAQDNEAF